MILDQRLLGLSHSLLDRMQLLRDIKARAPGLDHPGYAVEMPFSPLQPLENFGVALMEMLIAHAQYAIPLVGILSS